MRSCSHKIMKLEIDDGQVIETRSDGTRCVHSIGSSEAFHLISKAWLRSGWDAKYVYSFTWLGRPIIQLPEDMFRIQEVIYAVKPEVIIETGVAHGGSLIFHASLCRAMRRGQVIGVDVEIRPHNRKAIESHEMGGLINLVEGSSADPQIVARVRELVGSRQPVLVILDSNHSRDHVLAELEAYADLVTPGSFIVACDGIMKDLVGAPRSQVDWAENNPQTAVRKFLSGRPDFLLEEPPFPFNEGCIHERVTYWPNAFLRKTGVNPQAMRHLPS